MHECFRYQTLESKNISRQLLMARYSGDPRYSVGEWTPTSSTSEALLQFLLYRLFAIKNKQTNKKQKKSPKCVKIILGNWVTIHSKENNFFYQINYTQSLQQC